MPELPEVETTRLGIQDAILNQRIKCLVVRDRRLRWPIDPELERLVAGQRIVALSRRAKYILINLERGSIIWHLGMSGSIRLIKQASDPQKHDHVDLLLDNGLIVRYNDPRRFGCVLWGGESVLSHALLRHLGPEPLEDNFNANYLYAKSRGRRATIKSFVMDQKVVVGVGNIYASEALFLSGILPTRQAQRISLARYSLLVEKIKQVLEQAILQGGTTLRDFTQADGRPGYFEQQLNVYGRAGSACTVCGVLIRNKVIAQRASYYCPVCQR